MEKRKDKRLKKRSLIKVDDKAGMLLDISEDGIKVALSSLPTHRQIRISLQLDGEEFNLSGTIRWIKKTFSAHGSNELGIHLEDPPPTFITAVSRIGGPIIAQ